MRKLTSPLPFFHINFPSYQEIIYLSEKNLNVIYILSQIYLSFCEYPCFCYKLQILISSAYNKAFIAVFFYCTVKDISLACTTMVKNKNFCFLPTYPNFFFKEYKWKKNRYLFSWPQMLTILLSKRLISCMKSACKIS